jgi:branched-chain amino acid transport system permease protein
MTGVRLSGWSRRALAVGAIAVAACFPLLFSSAAGWVDTATLAMAYVIMALGINVVVGYAGLLDLGYVAFFAIGAYCTGWFMSSFYAGADVHLGVSGVTAAIPGIHVSFLLVAPVAMALCALAGIVIGLPTLRLRSDYIALVTLAFGEIIRTFANNGSSIHVAKDAPLTNGSQGITPIDPIELPLVGQLDLLNLRPWYWLALCLALLVLFVCVRIRDSRIGRAWNAIREDEVAAAATGVPLVRMKLLAYAIGAAFGGLGGAFLGSYLNTVNSGQFAFTFSIFILAMVILGGVGSVTGVVLGAVILSVINFRLIPYTFSELPQKFGLDFQLADLSFGIFGALLVLMMLLRPAGLFPERRHRIELAEGVGVGVNRELVEGQAR